MGGGKDSVYQAVLRRNLRGYGLRGREREGSRYPISLLSGTFPKSPCWGMFLALGLGRGVSNAGCSGRSARRCALAFPPHG